MIYRFHEFRLDPEKQLLYRNGELLEVEHRVFRFLLLLIERYPETLTRRELLEALWPHQEISDWALSQLIRRTRQLLGDNSRSPTYIKTIHGVGIRFLVMPEQLSESESVVQKKAATTGSWSRRLLASGLLLAILAATQVAYRSLNSSPLDVKEYPYTVAVLPFENATSDEGQAWVRLGLMDMVRQFLDESAGIHTVDTGRVIAYLTDMGEEAVPLSSENLENVFRSLCGDLGCQVLLWAELEDAYSQPRIRYRFVTSRGVSQSKSVVGSTVMDAGASLARSFIELVDPAQPWLVDTRNTYSSDDAANQAYALGSQELFNGQYASAIQFLEIALRRVPDFVWARARLAQALYRKGELDKAWELTRELLADEELPPRLRYQVLRVVSNIQYARGELTRSRETSLQLRELARASGDLAGEAAETMNIGTSYQAAGDTRQALRYLLEARELYRQSGYRPGLGMALFNIGNAYMTVNDYQRAEDFYGQAELEFLRLGNHQRVAMTRFQQVVILKARGDLDKAEKLLRELLPLFQALDDGEGEALVKVELASVHILDGRYELAIGEIQDFLPEFRKQGFGYAIHMVRNLMALAYLNLHEPELAREHILSSSEYSSPDPYYALLPAHLAYEERRFADAVQLAHQARNDAGEAWKPRHDAFLQAYETALADGKWREITY